MPFDIPDIVLDDAHVIRGESFAAGLLNFLPYDGKSIAAVRADPDIKKYARKVREYLVPRVREQDLISAMREAEQSRRISEETEKVFEILCWSVKPINYVPVLGTYTAAMTDVWDILKKWIGREKNNEGWYLIGPRMADINLREYLSRKSNQ